jgi:ABC-type lipoprotein export system ATPase subunit
MNSDKLQEILDVYGGDIDVLVKDLKALSSKKLPSKPKKNHSYGEVVVSLKGVSKTYKQGKATVEALKKASLEIRQGEFVSLVGPSGSGKSTLLNIVAGLDKPTEGDVVVDGKALKEMSEGSLAEYRNKTLGFVFQFFYLQPFLSLQTNVEVPLMFAGSSKAKREVRAAELLEAVGLSDRAVFLPKQLSGGQMQRAAIARALVNEPKLILADEPTGNLDKANGQNIMDLFEEIREKFNTTLVVVTHDEAVARRADRVIKMEDGAVV